MQLSAPRSISTAIGLVISVLLVGSVITSASADEDTAALAAPLVGEPRAVLIENLHAAGKVLEIGNDLAAIESTATAGKAAAASFPISTSAADLLKQRVFVYPVLAVPNAVLLANADGELLVRRNNVGGDFRYLSLSTVSLDEAAADPYAQWTFVDAGSGLFAINSVQRDSSNRIPSLDMYNWANASGAEIQTYDAGTAAVQRWRIHSLDAVVSNPAPQVVVPGAQPPLPTSINTRYAWGQTFALTNIAWQLPSESVWMTDGQVDVTGIATGFLGEPITVTASYTVGALGDPAETVLNSYAGVSLRQLQMAAPTQVQRPVSGSTTTVTARVTWDWSTVKDADLVSEGSVTVSAAPGQGFAATLRIQLAPAASVNLLRSIPSHAVAKHNDGAINLTNGTRTGGGFSDWRSGGAGNRMNPNTVTLILDSPQQVTGVGVFDGGGTNNIGRVTVQVRDVRGGWVNLPADGVSWPVANATPGLSLIVDSTPMLVTGVRVTITNKSSSSWMTLSEIELYGPAAAQ